MKKKVRATLATLATGAKVRAVYGRLDRATGVEYVGEVLALDDPRAWLGSLAFPGEATQAEVTAHVAKCEAAWAFYSKGKGTLDGSSVWGESVPVLWGFGRVYWEKIRGLLVVEA